MLSIGLPFSAIPVNGSNDFSSLPNFNKTEYNAESLRVSHRNALVDEEFEAAGLYTDEDIFKHMGHTSSDIDVGVS